MAFASANRPTGDRAVRQELSCGKWKPAENSQTVPTTQGLVIGQLSDSNICRVGDHVTVSRTPVLSACRELLAQGVDPDRALEIHRAGILALRVRSIREGAHLTVREDRGAPEFSRYKALALDAVRPQAAIEPMAGVRFLEVEEVGR